MNQVLGIGGIFFKPPFTINLRVANLDELLAKLRAEGVTVHDKTDKSEFGYFGW
jgi:hypothetical protein